MPLDAAQTQEASRRVARWRADPAEPVACPVCERPGLIIIDRSARPYAEWYALQCTGCGLNETLHIALAAPIQSPD
jgi:hypothetical protein